MKICLAQLNFTIGDFEKNTEKIYNTIEEARLAGADLVVFSELAVCGYPPEDFLDYPWFVEKCEQSFDAVAQCTQHVAVICGGIIRNPGNGRALYNAACFMNKGKIQQTVYKTLLPTYDIFNEGRYFEPQNQCVTFDFRGVKIGIAICEDLWDQYNDFIYTKSPVTELVEAGAQLIINPSASPFNLGKDGLRNRVLEDNCARFNVPIIYVNQVGAHTDIIFDGQSRAINYNAQTVYKAAAFTEDIGFVKFENNELTAVTIQPQTYTDTELLHKALVFGIKEYFGKMGFTKAVLGSSGGIDSAVVQALAVEALGASNVMAFLMPSEFSSEGSISDAQKLCENLGNPHEIIPIKDIYEQYMQSLRPIFKDKAFDVTEENLQARARGMLLMAYSNKMGNILLNTGNKSELAVGYCTLYGDMCGGLAVIGDVYKTKVYDLAREINKESEIIPKSIIFKAPSAELRPGQKDSDSLPEYEILDDILQNYIEKQRGRDEIKLLGFDASVVDKVVNLVNRNEYKRFQSPPILRVTNKSFGSGRRMPLVAKYG